MKANVAPCVGALAAASLAVTAAGVARAGEKLSESDEMRSTLRRVTACAVEDNAVFAKGKAVVFLLESLPSGPEFQRFYDDIRNCLQTTSYEGRSVSQMRFAPTLLKGQIYRSIVLRGWGAKARPAYAADFHRIAAADRSPTADPLGAFGICVATLDRENALKAIDSPTGGDKEATAYQALMPSFSRCVSPGQQIKFSKQILEGALAEGLFVATFSTSSDITMKKPN